MELSNDQIMFFYQDAMSSVELAIQTNVLNSFPTDVSWQAGGISPSNCDNCDAFLVSGIAACEWLFETEQSFLNGHKLGIVRYSDELHQKLHSLFLYWMDSCGIAEGWIKALTIEGYSLQNGERFYQCRESVIDWLETYDLLERSKRARLANEEVRF